jgi:dTDP-4-amino-4,6-dideoxygalactose transaminase
MLVSNRRDIAERARHLSTQARQPVAHYEHEEVGYNYRLSNLLAAIGRGQLAGLDAKIARRREINAVYRAAFAETAGITFMPEASYGRSNGWLTCVTIDGTELGVNREAIRQHLESVGIESRPVWKPMHLQPVFRECAVRGGRVAEALFTNGLCLPSGSSLTAGQQDRVIASIREAVAQQGAVEPRLVGVRS